VIYYENKIFTKVFIQPLTFVEEELTVYKPLCLALKVIKISQNHAFCLQKA
jgi:hypothetical protein